MEFEKIKNIISEVLSINADTITEESTFVDDLGADSLDIFQIITVSYTHLDVYKRQDQQFENLVSL